MDYNVRNVYGPTGILISLVLVSIRQPVAVARSQVSVAPYASGRAGPFEACLNVTSGEEGRCMFAMDCFRARGRHVGICTKGFYFGSCCSLPTYSSSTADPPRPSPRPTPPPMPRPPPPMPLTSVDTLPRVPIVLESNDIDGPPASPSPFDPLDVSFWPDLLANIYGLKPQPVAAHKFPYSTFHAPANGNNDSASTSWVKADVNNLTTSTMTPSTLKTTVTTTMTLSSSTSTTATTFSSTESSVGTTMAMGLMRPNVTVIYANATVPVENETPWVVPVESWLEEVEEPTTSIPTTSSTTQRPTSTPLPNVTSSTTIPTTSQTVAITDERNTSVVLLPSSVPASSSGMQRHGTVAAVCGKPVYRWPKIVSGENARLGQWPWQVTLQEKTRRGYFHKCGASLLSKDWVITAAHCLSNVQPESLLVRLGGIDFASVEDKWTESRVQLFPHPQFNIQTQQNDIALLKLLTPLVAYQSTMLPICLPDKDMEFDGAQSFVSGWGRLGEKSPISTRLQYVGVPIINNTECQKIYQPINKQIDRQSICAGYAEGLKDSCEGDSGGPMMVHKRGRWVLAGVISWGVGCARPNQPGVSTRVTEFLDWIQSTLDADSLPVT
ncbi:hypothetical protein GHT06_008575 [Daphnia sinensis]|uniref:Peptidase S1 domain-containing protein n=1 Tax=Daphnia sinensis TaxID=1820382 RepID=A0AAD5L402_9CRUS|nr:hypothetical protein GHT06_008575 [Daphnia sinensis]